jgi:hypothetical protein
MTVSSPTVHDQAPPVVPDGTPPAGARAVDPPTSAPRGPAARADALRRRLLLLAGVVLCLSGALAPRTALADAPAPPVVTGLLPLIMVPDGGPLQVTLSGTDLAGVTGVSFRPAVAVQGVAVIGDSTLVVTLPAVIAPGEYTVTLTSAAGSTAASGARFTVAAASPASRPASPPPPTPAPSFAPSPQVAAEPATGLGSVQVRRAQESSRPVGSGRTPLLLLALAAPAVTLLVLLRRRSTAISEPRPHRRLAAAAGRFIRRLRLGRPCRQCGHLRLAVGAPRDLWRGGFCSAVCVARAHDDERAAAARMRELFVYAELDRVLQPALAGDALRLIAARASRRRWACP